MNIHEGGCSCGEIKYLLLDNPIFTHACHCSLCKKISGSAFIINSLLESWKFSLEAGKLVNCVGPSGSKKKHIVKRCSNCFEPIVSFFGPTEYLAVVKVGSLTEPNRFPPQAHVFVCQKLDWLMLDERIPKYKNFYDFERVLPSASYDRLKLVRAKQRSFLKNHVM